MSSIFDNLGIDPGIIIIILLVLTIFLLVKSVSSSMRLNRLERKYKTFMKGSDAQSLEKMPRLISSMRQRKIMNTISFLSRKIWRKCSVNMVWKSMMPLMM